MGVPYAEVIGDPVAHSKSPLIHKYWLERLGIAGDYRATRVAPGRLRAHLAMRRGDPNWRGCNVTAPLKAAAAEMVGAPAGLCGFVGAVNVVGRTALGCLVGTNSDIAGVGAALAGIDLAGARVTIIGAGGAARAALCHLARCDTAEITILARDVGRTAALGRLLPGRVAVRALGEATAGTLLINASPLGTAGHAPMHRAVLEAVRAAPPQAVFDMVYAPVETELLATARAAGALAIDGLSMLIGQAAPAFEIFFGAKAPRAHDAELRDRLMA